MNLNGCGRKRTYPDLGITSARTWKGWGNPLKPLVKIACTRVEIWTLDFLNTEQECYPLDCDSQCGDSINKKTISLFLVWESRLWNILPLTLNMYSYSPYSRVTIQASLFCIRIRGMDNVIEEHTGSIPNMYRGKHEHHIWLLILNLYN